VAFVITEACIGTKDRSCVDVCPVDCIHDESDDADQQLYIDPDECIDCGACEPACPVTAIYAEDDVPDNLKSFIEINSLWYKDKDAARAKVKEVHP
jgi:ferredoxin